MKKISVFMAAALLAAPGFLHAQDAATEERFNKLSADIQVLIEAKEAQNKRIDDLARAVDALQQQLNKPNVSYATADDVKQLASKMQEIDKKRQDDNEEVMRTLEKLGKTVSHRPAAPVLSNLPDTSSPPANSKGYDYVIQSGDTLSAVIAAYQAKNIKLKLDQVLKANPGLDPNKLRVGQKIFLPAPTE